ncbi:MAG: diguanylate cyclase domain-containing protein [Arenimonas sp.]
MATRVARLLIVCMLCIISAQALAIDPPLSRHPLETRALIDPKGVLSELPALLEQAQASKDNKELALLYLAQSNACRVVADWSCQTQAAQNARIAAIAANLPELQVRGLIAESRGLMQLQEFNRGENLLGEAVRLLKLHPFPELSADVYLAYSSMSYTLGKHALAEDYAARGLVALNDNPALLIRTRLLRNQSRAMAQLGNISQAQNVLKTALTLTEKIQDPKLSAELFLEDARIARLKNDVPTQVSNGHKILALGKQLNNLQLAGLGHEVLGLAAINNADSTQAERELFIAYDVYRKLNLERDERQVLRALIQNMLEQKKPRAELDALMTRLIELEASLDGYDRKQATDDFNARLKYVQQEFDVKQLKASAALALQREKNLEIQQRFMLIVAALSTLLLIVAVGFYLSQRRFNQRLRKANEQLSLSETRMRAIANNIPALISHLDHEQRYLFSNSFSGRVFGIDTETMIGKSVREVRGEALYVDLKPYIETALRGESISFEGKSDVNGRLYFYQTSYVPDRDANGNVQGFFALTFDITDLKLAEAELERLSRIDGMTEVANRRCFEERLSSAIATGQNQNGAIALLFLDIDNLKTINDENGHHAGDVVITTFAERLQRCVQADDLVARLGGDEFAVIIESPTPESGENIAKKFRTIMEKPVLVDDMKLMVTASIGVAYCAQTPQAKELMSLADKALYAAKSAGRANYQTVVGQ